ncbi:HNH endonuclease signature motif containing protein [Cellulomonas sp. URHD0024]|uniref:HNH endonuclease signature motif containing protein n=1 Tax=Cellulomonas sp. URHD0024 TaxID=1302620 RepID=UPI0004032BD2|nr:HNH endonuclease signature motif containing protein [Cellulomonas sp. URHD0024]
MGVERTRVLGRLDVLEGVIATVRGQLLIAERDSGEWRRPGIGSLEAARSAVSRSGSGAARREVQQAEALAVLPSVATAVGAGTVPVEHLNGIARLLSTASEHVTAVLASPHGQQTLVAMACEQDAPTFARNVSRWAASLDPAAHERDHQAQRRERFLHLSDQPDGTHVRGRLDRMTGHVLRLALEAVGEAPGDDRSPEQARADALGAVAQKVLSMPDTGSGSAVRPHVSLIVTEETWAAFRALPDNVVPVTLLPAPGAGCAAAGFEPATLPDGMPVPMSEALRALCDAEMTRVVMRAGSEPMDIGRTERLYTGVQRRAVIARDRCCVYPGCGKPARWGEVHHIRWWSRDGGTTSVDNAVLLCVFHHKEVHRFQLSIERLPAAPGGAGGARGRAGGAGPPPTYVFRLPSGAVLAGSARRAAGRPEDPVPTGMSPTDDATELLTV